MEKSLKELLLRDLCARLPYGVKVINTAEVNEVGELDSIMTSRKYKDKLFVGVTLPDDVARMVEIEMIKPYLRPMSSMTEDEKRDWWTYKQVGETWEAQDSLSVDWLNKCHFDYRGLIEKGLALEAPEDMYKN